MTTQQAKQVLRCSIGTLDLLYKKGKIRKVKGPNGRVDWDETDIYEMAGMEPGSQVTVVYARVEPTDGSRVSAEDRLEAQKERLVRFCQGYGVPVDLVIGEVRRVNRVRAVDGSAAVGFSTLMGLISERRVRKLIIESRDRFMVGASWEMLEWVLKLTCGVEIVVVNKVAVTRESREESKYWIADMLQIYKIMTGEIKDKKMIQQFIGGPDPKLAKTGVRKLDEALRQKKRLERAIGQTGKVKKMPVDLDELF